eukprot:CAMPEP_0170569200 /NCGR_PEP_ID=MMETSP0224-20130122/404_1 /TAXON_ID=285029 /ORGANISM="Togula jolla, Strain CCCM 725" /LENGTH=395 /DNA_ID=CAMNT_0010891303 /DNA_START=84 /DNA_END=1268 /DNA_ORIENTATION=-
MVKDGLSNFNSTCTILKGLIGVGVLTLPYATKQVGWLVSVVGLGFVAWLQVIGLEFAVKGKAILDGLVPSEVQNLESDSDKEGKEHPFNDMSFYDEVVRRAYGWVGQRLCEAFIVIGQFGTAVAYVNVITETICTYQGESIRPFVLMALAALLTGLSSIRSLKGISVLSKTGLLIYLFVFGSLLWSSARAYQHGTWMDSATWAKSDPNIGLWFGASCFALGVFGVAIVVHDDMAEPADFLKVVRWSFFYCWAFYASFAFLGYMCFGDQLKEVVYLNFPDSIARGGSAIAVCAVLIVTYIVQLLPVYTLAEHLVPATLHYAIPRTLIVFLTVLCAFELPSVTFIIQSVGATTGVLSCTVFPALVYLKLHPNPSVMDYISAGLLLVFALAAMTQIEW